RLRLRRVLRDGHPVGVVIMPIHIGNLQLCFVNGRFQRHGSCTQLIDIRVALHRGCYPQRAGKPWTVLRPDTRSCPTARKAGATCLRRKKEPRYSAQPPCRGSRARQGCVFKRIPPLQPSAAFATGRLAWEERLVLPAPLLAGQTVAVLTAQPGCETGKR